MPIAKNFLLKTTEFDLQTRLLSEWKSGVEVAGVTGLEPAASGVTGQRSNQLSYTPKPSVKTPESTVTTVAFHGVRDN